MPVFPPNGAGHGGPLRHFASAASPSGPPSFVTFA